MAIDFGKKIAGVPVVYLGAGVAAILGVVAWRMKATEAPTDNAPTGTGEDAVLDESGFADGSNPYAGFSTNGTVIVQPAPTPEPVEPDKPDTNDEWIRAGAEWLVATKDVPGTAAYSALSKYVVGTSRSIQEGQWVEAVIKEKGFPPDNIIETPLPPVSTPPPPATAPTPAMSKPTGLKATAINRTSVALDWLPVPGALGYSAFKNGVQYGRTVLGSDYVILGLTPGTKYTFSVAAVYAGWKVGPQAAIPVTTKR